MCLCGLMGDLPSPRLVWIVDSISLSRPDPAEKGYGSAGSRMSGSFGSQSPIDGATGLEGTAWLFSWMVSEFASVCVCVCSQVCGCVCRGKERFCCVGFWKYNWRNRETRP